MTEPMGANKGEITLADLAIVFDKSLDAVLVVDDGGHFRYANKACLDLIGYDFEELVKRSILDLDPIPAKEWQQRFKVMTARGSLRAEIELLTKDGTMVVVLSVKDYGVGMSDDVRERIFEPFFTTKGVGEGTGLGLATVYAIVDRLGGFICVNSIVDYGTSFDIHLPAGDQEQRLRQTEILPEPAKGKQELVLVAEDEALIRNLAVRILEDANYRVITASDGLEAQKIFRAHSDEIKLCLLDAVMPKCTGFLAAKTISAINPAVPIIFCSGYSYETLRSSNIDVATAKILKKPFGRSELLSHVRKAIEGL